MTPIYEVNTKHSKEMLYRFIDFDYKQRHGRIPMHLIMFGICCFTVAVLLYRHYGNIGSSVPWICVGIFLVLLVFLRRPIAFLKLSTQDENYEKQNVIRFSFGHSEWTVKNEDQVSRIQYSEISGLYKDKKYYYISTQENELFLLPFQDFVKGEAEKFQAFVEEKSKKATHDMALPFKQRYHMKLAQIKANQAKADAAWEEQRQRDREKAMEKKRQRQEKKRK